MHTDLLACKIKFKQAINTVNYFNQIVMESKDDNTDVLMTTDDQVDDVIDLDTDVFFGDMDVNKPGRKNDVQTMDVVNEVIKASNEALVKLGEVLGEKTGSIVSDPTRGVAKSKKCKPGKRERAERRLAAAKNNPNSDLSESNNSTLPVVSGESSNGKSGADKRKGKRNRSPTEPSPKGQGARKRHDGRTDRSFRDTVIDAMARMIVDAKHPSRTFTKADLDHLSDKLQRCIVTSLSQNERPKIESTSRANGRFVVRCADQATCDWLGRIVETGLLKSVQGKNLAVRNQTEGAEQVRMKTWFLAKQGLSWQGFKKIITTQNDHIPINTNDWNYHTHVRRGEGWLLFFGIGQDSLEALEHLNFRPYFVDRRICLKKLTDGDRNKAN